jgi:hypothetical protein
MKIPVVHTCVIGRGCALDLGTSATSALASEPLPVLGGVSRVQASCLYLRGLDFSGGTVRLRVRGEDKSVQVGKQARVHRRGGLRRLHLPMWRAGAPICSTLPSFGRTHRCGGALKGLHGHLGIVDNIVVQQCDRAQVVPDTTVLFPTPRPFACCFTDHTPAHVAVAGQVETDHR